MSFKNSLGLSRKLSKDIMYGWLQELTPQERSDLTIMRLLRKLDQIEIQTKKTTETFKVNFTQSPKT